MVRLLRRIRNRIRYRRFSEEIAEELAFHREMKREECPTTVGRAMGNELRMRELAREVWIPQSIDALGQDLRDAFRMIIRRPLLAAASVAALVLGVGGATTAFSLLKRARSTSAARRASG
jgi:hypothetical protein